MPFQSEKQRRYLWANEPEIARDWTDTYGSGIAKALGGRIGFWNGSGNIRQQPHQPRDLLVQNNPRGIRPRYQPPGGGATSLGSGRDFSPAPSDRGPRDAPDRRGPVQTVTQSTGDGVYQDRIMDVAQRKQRQDVRDLIDRQQAEKDYTRQGMMKPGPQLGLTRSRIGGGLGDWASQFAGSKIGGGLGSMLFGPWGMLLGSLFGRGVGKRGYQAYQTPKRETWKDIAFGENTLLSNLFNKRINEQPRREGIERIDMSDMRDRFNQGDDLSSIEEQQAKLVGPALIQYRDIERKIKGYIPDMDVWMYGKPTERDKKLWEKLQKKMKEEKIYKLPTMTV